MVHIFKEFRIVKCSNYWGKVMHHRRHHMRLLGLHPNGQWTAPRPLDINPPVLG